MTARKKTAAKKPEPKYPDLVAGLERLGLPSDPMTVDIDQHPTYVMVLREFLGATK